MRLRVLVALFAIALRTCASAEEAIVLGLDHIPIAVGDLRNPIVGLSVAVEDLRRTERVLSGLPLSAKDVLRCEGRSIWLAPGVAHGVWLELRETPQRP